MFVLLLPGHFSSNHVSLAAKIPGVVDIYRPASSYGFCILFCSLVLTRTLSLGNFRWLGHNIAIKLSCFPDIPDLTVQLFYAALKHLSGPDRLAVTDIRSLFSQSLLSSRPLVVLPRYQQDTAMASNQINLDFLEAQKFIRGCGTDPSFNPMCIHCGQLTFHAYCCSPGLHRVDSCINIFTRHKSK